MFLLGGVAVGPLLQPRAFVFVPFPWGSSLSVTCRIIDPLWSYLVCLYVLIVCLHDGLSYCIVVWIILADALSQDYMKILGDQGRI
jgi:amino acid permease